MTRRTVKAIHERMFEPYSREDAGTATRDVRYLLDEVERLRDVVRDTDGVVLQWLDRVRSGRRVNRDDLNGMHLHLVTALRPENEGIRPPRWDFDPT